MNPMIDLAMIMVVVTALALLWPYLRDAALLLEQMENEYIARQLEESQDWRTDRDDYNIHKSL
jgi:hypothetical protein